MPLVGFIIIISIQYLGEYIFCLGVLKHKVKASAAFLFSSIFHSATFILLQHTI